MAGMKRPENVDVLTQCVRIRFNKVYIFCVECDDWKQVGLLSRDIVLRRQNGTRSVVERDGDDFFVCDTCQADIGYLLLDNYRLAVRNRIG